MGQKLRKFKDDVIEKLESRPTNDTKAATESGDAAAVNGTTQESVDISQVEAKVDNAEAGGGEVEKVFLSPCLLHLC